jgi:RNA polymerase sigma-70 factor (ECF subfamily)
VYKREEMPIPLNCCETQDSTNRANEREMNMSIKTKTESQADGFEAATLIYMDSIYRFALYMAGNEIDAQNLVQNTYLKAYKSFGELEEGNDSKAWLFSILNAICCDRRYPQAIAPSDAGKRSSDSDHANFSDSSIADAVRELPIKYRSAVLLADMEGFSYKEIADILGRSVEIVMSRVRRGRGILRKKLKGNGTQEIGEAAG